MCLAKQPVQLVGRHNGQGHRLRISLAEHLANIVSFLATSVGFCCLPCLPHPLYKSNAYGNLPNVT